MLLLFFFVENHKAWFHSGSHPSEVTSYFIVEGMIEFLISNDPKAVTLRERATIYILPAVNPDGLTRGNYRTNSKSLNLESHYGKPFNVNSGRARESQGFFFLFVFYFIFFVKKNQF